MAWKGPRSPKHIVIIAILRSYLSPLFLLLGRDPCGDSTCQLRKWGFWTPKPSFRRWAEYGFGEHGFKHRAQWVFLPSPSSGERAQWVPLSLLFVWQSELTEFSRRTHRVCPKTQWGSVSSLLRNSTLETVLRPFPIFSRNWGLGPVILSHSAMVGKTLWCLEHPPSLTSISLRKAQGIPKKQRRRHSEKSLSQTVFVETPSFVTRKLPQSGNLREILILHSRNLSRKESRDKFWALSSYISWGKRISKISPNFFTENSPRDCKKKTPQKLC